MIEMSDEEFYEAFDKYMEELVSKLFDELIQISDKKCTTFELSDNF